MRLFLLDFSDDSDLSLSQRTLSIVGTRYNHAYFLQFQVLCYHFNITFPLLAINDEKFLRIAVLMGFVYCLNNCPNSVMMEGVIRKITIEKTKAHLVGSFTHPVLYEIMHLSTVHELDVVYVSVLLTANCYCFWLAVRAKSLGIGRMAAASFINFKSKIDGW